MERGGGIDMKYKTGDKVTHFTGICGMITKTLLDTNIYWFVYLKGDGELSRIEVDECEIEGYTEDNKIGFGRKDDVFNYLKDYDGTSS